jgi:hypothetical protein
MENEVKNLENECERIEILIDENYVDEVGNTRPIVDGIVDIKTYLKSKYKILWILKEPYDDDGGGWHYSKKFLLLDNFYSEIKQSFNTWHPIIYVCHGILNDFMQYETMDWIRDEPWMADIVKQIAVINVNKLPGLSRTYDYGLISEAYNKYKGILLEQIKVYNPDIIIGGYTLNLFFDDLGIQRDTLTNHGSVDFAVKDGKLFIDAWHPAQTTKVGRKEYVNDIINTAKEWSYKRL